MCKGFNILTWEFVVSGLVKWFFLFVVIPFCFAEASSIYIPENYFPKTAKVVVVIHGCLQSAESMSLGTGFNKVADQKNLVIIYPQVKTNSNYFDCWNWFLQKNQLKNSGQLNQIHKKIESILENLSLTKAPRFVVGMSSGGASAAGLIACFPDSFQGAALVSSPSYGSARNPYELEKVLKNGPSVSHVTKEACSTKSYSGKLLVAHGKADPVVNYKHALRSIKQFLPKKLNEQIDNKFVNERETSITHYSHSTKVKGLFVLIDNFEHAWPGYRDNIRKANFVGPLAKTPTTVPFFDLYGPNITKMIVSFFDL